MSRQGCVLIIKLVLDNNTQLSLLGFKTYKITLRNPKVTWEALKERSAENWDVMELLRVVNYA